MITSAPTSRIAALQRVSYTLNDELYARYAERDADRVSDLLQVLMRGGDELFDDRSGTALLNALSSLEAFGRQQVDMADAAPIGVTALELESDYEIAELDNVAQTLTSASSREGVRALALRATHGWSWDEISADTGLSVRSAKARARNAGKAIAAGTTGRTKLVGCNDGDSALAKAIFGDYNETSEKECELVEDFLEHQVACNACHELYVTLVRACHVAAALLPPLAPGVGARQALAYDDDEPAEAPVFAVAAPVDTPVAELEPLPSTPEPEAAADDEVLPEPAPEPAEDEPAFVDIPPAEIAEPAVREDLEYFDPVYAAVYDVAEAAAPLERPIAEEPEPDAYVEEYEPPAPVAEDIAPETAQPEEASPVFFDQDSESEQLPAPAFAFSITEAAAAARELIPGADDEPAAPEPVAEAVDAHLHDAALAALAAEALAEPALTEDPYESWAAEQDDREVTLARATTAAAAPPVEIEPEVVPTADVIEIGPPSDEPAAPDFDPIRRPLGVGGASAAFAAAGLREATSVPEVPILKNLPPLPDEYVQRFSEEAPRGDSFADRDDFEDYDDADERRFERRAIAAFAAACLLFFLGFLGIGTFVPESPDRPVAQAPTPATGKPAAEKKTKVKKARKKARRHKKHVQRPAQTYVPQQTQPVVQSQPAPAPKASSGVDDGSAEFLPEERG